MKENYFGIMKQSSQLGCGKSCTLRAAGMPILRFGTSFFQPSTMYRYTQLSRYLPRTCFFPAPYDLPKPKVFKTVIELVYA